ncbi:MAG: nucleotidyltransferase family protein, partial [Casimicrobiaceae bacterium]
MTDTGPGAQPSGLRIVGILLAAGKGARFGGGKLLAPLRTAFDDIPAGTPIGAAACRHLVAALPETIAVVRPGDSLLAAMLAAEGARVIECATADEGMGASLACGVSASADAAGWVIALGDMPWIQAATTRAVAAAIAAGADIATPEFDGRRGHPVAFAHRHGVALAGREGDEGARALLAAHKASIRMLAVADAGVVR